MDHFIDQWKKQASEWPDSRLLAELQNPSGAVPIPIISMEAHDRAQRQTAQKQLAAMQQWNASRPQVRMDTGGSVDTATADQTWAQNHQKWAAALNALGQAGSSYAGQQQPVDPQQAAQFAQQQAQLLADLNRSSQENEQANRATMARFNQQHRVFMDDGGDVDDAIADQGGGDPTLLAVNRPPAFPHLFSTSPVTPGFAGMTPQQAAAAAALAQLNASRAQSAPAAAATPTATTAATAPAPQQAAQHDPTFWERHPTWKKILSTAGPYLSNVSAGMAGPGGNLATGLAYADQAMAAQRAYAAKLQMGQQAQSAEQALEALKLQHQWAKDQAQMDKEKADSLDKINQRQQSALNDGATFVDPTATVPIQTPTFNPADPNTPAWQTQQAPAPYNRANTINLGGRLLEYPKAAAPLTLAPDVTSTLGLPPGYQPDPKQYLSYVKTANDIKQAQSKEEPVPQQALHVATQVVANQMGITLDPAKPLIDQLPLPGRQQVFALAKQYGETDDAKLMRQSILESQEINRELIRARIADLTKKNQLAGQPTYTPDGSKQMKEIDTVSKQFDQVADQLEKYKNDNNPLALRGAILAYKNGIKSPEGSLGEALSNLSLAAISGAMPYASKSRNWQYIQQIQQHLPVTDFWHADSPANAYAKVMNVKRNFLRMEAQTRRYEVKGAGPDAPPPVLGPNHIKAYIRIAGGDPDQAKQFAVQDGWALPQTGDNQQ